MELDKIITSLGINSRQEKGNERNPRAYKRELLMMAQNALAEWKFSDHTFDSGSGLFQVLDLFCGCGGMSLGFAALSKLYPFFNVVGGCDIDTYALESFKRNLNSPGISEDVRMLAHNDDLLGDFLSKLGKYNPEKPLVLIGCAPCQGFTSHRKKTWATTDQRNELIVDFAHIAAKLNPVCVVMENVPEMLSQKYWGYFQEAKNILENSGYIVKQAIYNAASFGVPQDRFRVLVLAMKHDFLLPEALISDPIEFITVREAIGNLPPVYPGKTHPNDTMHRSVQHKVSTLNTIRAIPKDGGSRPYGVGPHCLDRVKGFYDVYGRLYWDRPSITITHYARNPASGRFVHPEQDRGLTMREVALLQSFPVGFDFVGPIDSIYKQIGEAAPPKFACAIAVNTIVELTSDPPEDGHDPIRTPSIIEPISNSYSSVIAGIKVKRLRDELHMR